MTITSGSIGQRKQNLKRLTLRKPERAWRDEAELIFDDILSYSNNKSGWMDLGDVETQNTPLELTGSGDTVRLTNDLSSSFTDTGSMPNGISPLWNPNTDYMNFSSNGIAEDDIVLIRVDYSISPDIVPMEHQLIFNFYSGENGAGSKIFDNIVQMPDLNNDAGTFKDNVFTHHFYVGNSIISGSMNISIRGTTSAQIKTNAFFIAIDRTGI